MKSEFEKGVRFVALLRVRDNEDKSVLFKALSWRFFCFNFFLFKRKTCNRYEQLVRNPIFWYFDDEVDNINNDVHVYMNK